MYAYSASVVCVSHHITRKLYLVSWCWFVFDMVQLGELIKCSVFLFLSFVYYKVKVYMDGGGRDGMDPPYYAIHVNEEKIEGIFLCFDRDMMNDRKYILLLLQRESVQCYTLRERRTAYTNCIHFLRVCGVVVVCLVVW